jgi:hypothetical protein
MKGRDDGVSRWKLGPLARRRPLIGMNREFVAGDRGWSNVILGRTQRCVL